jgi:hypothetical protein
MTYMAYVIYNELRTVAANFVQNPPQMDPYGGPPPRNPQQASGFFPAPGNAAYDGPNQNQPQASNAQQNKSGFKAFGGKGYRLGDS